MSATRSQLAGEATRHALSPARGRGAKRERAAPGGCSLNRSRVIQFSAHVHVHAHAQTPIIKHSYVPSAHGVSMMMCSGGAGLRRPPNPPPAAARAPCSVERTWRSVPRSKQCLIILHGSERSAARPGWSQEPRSLMNAYKTERTTLYVADVIVPCTLTSPGT